MDMQRYSREMHRPTVKTSHFQKVVVAGRDDVWGLDLVDMAKDWVAENDGYRHILVVVDIFSRFAWARALKTKTGTEVWAAFSDIIMSSNRAPTYVWADQGSEFYNSFWKARLAELGIKLYSTYSDEGCSLVERLNRSLKGWTWQYFTWKQTRRWVDVLPLLMNIYNERVHASLGMTPTQASMPAVEKRLWVQQYGKAAAEAELGVPKYPLGQWVRIARKKGAFEKGYHPNWSYEVYKVRRIGLNPPVTYYLQDYFGQPYEGAFYENELTPTDQPDVMLVDHIIKSRIRNGVREVLVKWHGYPKPTWQPEANILGQ
jgi:hypothetical protein